MQGFRSMFQQPRKADPGVWGMVMFFNPAAGLLARWKLAASGQGCQVTMERGCKSQLCS